MREELEKELFEIGKDFMHPDPTHQINLLGFGIECGDGWFDLLKKLIEDIKETNPPEDFEVFQIKEKFSELRFYTNNATDEIEQLIEVAENESVTICERCGDFAETKKINGWYYTVCDKCEEELK